MVAGAVAAVAKYPLPCIIFDLGTATTISVIDEKGYFLGGTICAGVSITLEALANKTALLPHINIEKPKQSSAPIPFTLCNPVLFTVQLL